MENTALALLFGIAAAVAGITVWIGNWADRREKQKLSRVQEKTDERL
jgi:hypothetical protein